MDNYRIVRVVHDSLSSPMMSVFSMPAEKRREIAIAVALDLLEHRMNGGVFAARLAASDAARAVYGNDQPPTRRPR